MKARKPTRRRKPDPDYTAPPAFKTKGKKVKPPKQADFTLRLRDTSAHSVQDAFVKCTAKRIVIRAGRRGGKTTGAARRALDKFLQGKRVLYAVPTTEQIDRFWKEVKKALAEPIAAGAIRKNETMHLVEFIGKEARIRAKTAWNADTLRGDYADELILDEWQLMAEDAWEQVGAPMLLDNNGDAVFIYTPPSLHSSSYTKARDPRHASRMFTDAKKEMAAAAEEGRTSRWAAFHFSSHDNPHISQDAIVEIGKDMTQLAYRQEILAEDVEEMPGALWTLRNIDSLRVEKHPDLIRIGVGVDPPGGVVDCGIVVAGIGMCPCRGEPELHGFILGDYSLKASPEKWGRAVVTAYNVHEADRIFGEKNFGGDMVESTVRGADPQVRYENVSASRGKAVRAEPVSALYERSKVHHVGRFDKLEEEMTTWVPGVSKWSPNRIDALVWVLTKLQVELASGHMADFAGSQPSGRDAKPIFSGIMTKTL